MYESVFVHELLDRIEVIAIELHSRKITGVKVRIGASAQVSAERLHEQFTRAAQHTVAHGARLDIETTPEVTPPPARRFVLENVEIAD
jgi:Zn finger protein HypA/HybF involved in hydrogenase expression